MPISSDSPVSRTESLARTRSARTVLVVACVVFAAGCSDADRTAGHFCSELQAQLPALIAPPGTSRDVDDLVRRFKRLNGMTPLAIEEEWQIITDLVEKASDVIPSDPSSRQDLADAAYKAERPAREMAFWVESTCGFQMPDVIGIEGNRAP